MAPRRARTQGSAGDDDEHDNAPHSVPEDGLFVDLIMGTPLAMYVDKDVLDRSTILDLVNVRLYTILTRATRLSRRFRGPGMCAWMPLSSSCSVTIGRVLNQLQNNGGTVAPGYSSVPYILGMSETRHFSIIWLILTQSILHKNLDRIYIDNTPARRARLSSMLVGCASASRKVNCKLTNTIGLDAKSPAQRRT